MDDHLVADGHVAHRRADGVDDAGCVRATDVEVPGLTRLLADADDVDGQPSGRPHVVEVDAGGHHRHQDLVGGERGDVDFLDLERDPRVAEAVLADQLGSHPLRHLADGRQLTDRR
jgi:hypothetical protein